MEASVNSPAAESNSPATLNSLHPYRSDSRPLTGPITILLTAFGSSTRPTSAGVYPSAACR